MRLREEVALVTGSSSGIGRAIAVRFATEGARVMVTGRNVARGQAVVDGIRSRGGAAEFHAAELGDEAACAALIAATERLGQLTVLVNNAVANAGGHVGAVVDVDTDHWERVVRINLTAPMWLCRAAIPRMIDAGHGAIVNISSRAAERGTPGIAAYSASKGGLNALTRSVAVDYARFNIRCNSISPGYVLNDRRDADLDAERRARFEGMHLTRLGYADDVAHAAVYLASKESELLTGVNLPLDGGSSSARALTLG